MTLIITGKSTGFTLVSESHYAPRQLWYEVVSPGGFVNDLMHVMEALNAVENYLGITLTTWTSTLGNPLGAVTPFYAVRIGGSASDVGTFREAIDRLRLAGNVDPWTWYFAPTKEDLWSNFPSRRNAMSSITILEYLIAIGRIIGTGGSTVGTTNITCFHQPYVDTGSGFDDYYAYAGGGRYTLTQGERENYEVFRFVNYWITSGHMRRDQILSRRFSTPNSDADGSPNVYYDESTKLPALSDFREGYLVECAAQLDMPIFKWFDFTEGGVIENFEDFYDDLWELVDRSGGESSGDGLELSEVDSSSDISFIAGVCTSQGPVRFRFSTPGGESLQYVYEGEFEMTSETSGMDSVPALDEYGALDLTEIWGTVEGYTGTVMGVGPGNVNLNSPVWEHNEGNRVNVPYTTFPEPAPRCFHAQQIKPENRIEQEHIGAGVWRTSNTDPFEGLDDLPTDEDKMSTLLSRLRGIAGDGGGEGGSTVFDPSYQEPNAYFWCFPSYPFASGDGAIPDLATVFRPTPGGTFDGIPQDVATEWRTRSGVNGWVTKSTLDPHEEVFQQGFTLNLEARAYIEAKRTATINFPALGSSDSKWLVWTSAGSNGHSPFEECVTRF